MKMIPLLDKEGLGEAVICRRYHPPPLPLLTLRRGVIFLAVDIRQRGSITLILLTARLISVLISIGLAWCAKELPRV